MEKPFVLWYRQLITKAGAQPWTGKEDRVAGATGDIRGIDEGF
jgi:hypothetical protein